MTDQSATGPGRKRRRSLPQINPVWFLLAALIVAIVFMNPGFAEPTGYMNFLKRAAPLAILAAGQVYVIVSGGFDLSVGSLITLVVVGSSMLTDNDPAATYWVIPLMLCMGLGVGAVNGAIVCFLRVPSLIATLGTMITLNGLAFMWSGGAPRGYLPDTFRFFGRELIRDVPLVRFIPVSVIVLVVVVGVLGWLMHRTNLGRMVSRSTECGSRPSCCRVYRRPSRGSSSAALRACRSTWAPATNWRRSPPPSLAVRNCWAGAAPCLPRLAGRLR